MRYRTRLFGDRDIKNKKSNSQTSLYWMMEFLLEKEGLQSNAFLSPLPRPDGRYVTNERTLNKFRDIRIFFETQSKRFLRMLTSNPPVLNHLFGWLFIKKMKMKLKYFSDYEEYSHDKIYKFEPDHQIEWSVDDDFKIHNLGHASQLIQTEGMNILTDPVFRDLSIAYPSKTKDFKPDIKISQLPKIDAILISHNHRDHVDEPTLKAILETHNDPQIFVPKGDELYFRTLGFTKVHEFEWHEEIILRANNDHQIRICSVPADHCSRRHGFDGHKSLVSGWLISPEDRDEILYFAGDTARLDDIRLLSLSLDIYALYHEKMDLHPEQLPQIINMCPGGPNYTRHFMKDTHQSAVDSIIVNFRIALALEEISNKNGELIPAAQWLNKMATVFMHHNKFELGPDRFNENIFIFNRMRSYLEMDDESLATHLAKQQSKSTTSSLFHRRKDFIIEGVLELKEIAKLIWPDRCSEQLKHKLIDFINARTHFPLLMEKISTTDIYKFDEGEESTIKPKTSRGTKLPQLEQGLEGDYSNHFITL